MIRATDGAGKTGREIEIALGLSGRLERSDEDDRHDHGQQDFVAHLGEARELARAQKAD